LPPTKSENASVKTRVLDSWAILEWINARQPASKLVAEVLNQAEAGKVRLLMSAINAGEIYYFLRKHHSAALADDWRTLSQTLPVTVEVPTMSDIWDAATLKGQFPISYADAFAAALAQKYDCPLITEDREFRSVADLKLLWIGRT
jgi:predicted nucleic acid-binding protein